MANVTLTSSFANLPTWQGMLLEAPAGTTVLTKTATSFSFSYPAGSDFPGYKVIVSGTGFAYSGSVPTGGTMSQVRVLNASGQTVITFSGLAGNDISGDFAQFYSNVFGARTATGDGPNASGMAAWSHLMVGNDTITGTSGNDDRGLAGFDLGNDVYNMGAGDDWVSMGVGNDTMNGGDGWDTLSYSETTYNVGYSAYRGITANMGTRTVLDPWGGTDRFTGIEMVEGSRFNDKFIGGSDRDRFAGLRGRDNFDGGLNSYDASGNLLNDRKDEVRYSSDYWQGGTMGIVVDLETAFSGGSITGTIRDGFGQVDVVRDIERVVGTRFNDVFVGSRTDNQFSGGEGDDSYNGGAGWDGVDFGRWFVGNTGPTAGIRVDMTRTSGQVMNDGFGNVETMVGIEAIYGTRRADTVKGNTSNNEMGLGEGADTMTGAGGSDTFFWIDQIEFNSLDRITDFATSGAGADKLAFDAAGFSGMTSTVRVVNGTAATVAGQGTFVFNAVNDTLYWDGDGLGGAAMRSVVVLAGVNALAASNFEIWI